MAHCRFEKATLCGKLWFKSCQKANQDLPKGLPISFDLPQQYIESYESLIFEEARESILHSKLDKHACQTRATVVRYNLKPAITLQEVRALSRQLRETFDWPRQELSLNAGISKLSGPGG